MIMQASEAYVIAGLVGGLDPEQTACASSGEDAQVARIALMVA